MKYGRKPPIRTDRKTSLGIIFERALAPLGAPPAASDDYTSAVEKQSGPNWGMMGNDQWGDCVEADEAHYLMLRTANAGTIVVPTETDALALYSAETGFNPADPNTDQGTDEGSDCRFMVSTGFLGHQAAATGPIDYRNLEHMFWAVQLFGACKLGIAVTQAMEDQFNAGQAWDYVAGSPVLGLHDVPLVRYYADGSGDVITWGKRQHVTPAWLSASSGILDESHALVFPDWIKANGNAPSGFDLAQLLSDANEIESGYPGTHSHRWHIKRRRRKARAGQ